jgi:hypothetical protein
MSTHRTLGCDAADPHRLAAFRAQALGCVTGPGHDEPDGASYGERLDHVVRLDPEGNEFRGA